MDAFLDLGGELVRAGDIVVVSPLIKAPVSWQGKPETVGSVVRLRHGGQVETDLPPQVVVDRMQQVASL